MQRTGRVLLGLILLVAVTASASKGFSDSTGIKVQIKKLEFGYRLDASSMRARVTLVTGEALDFEVEDRDTFLRLAEVFAAGRARLAAQVQDGKVVALDVSIP